MNDTYDRDIRERRRSNRWAALVPIGLTIVALLPLATLGVWVAIEVTS